MKGICFIEPLFHKVVKGEKTQTRRMIVSRTGHFQVSINSMSGVITGIWQTDDNGWGGVNLIPINPKYKVGEKVYLKEPYYEWDEWDAEDGQFSYRFNKHMKVVPYWENKLFMPESAARYFIEITEIRAERLQNISDEDCMKEGIKRYCNEYGFTVRGIDALMPHGNAIAQRVAYYYEPVIFLTPQEAYAALINKINGKGTWEKNPFVWVYDFKLTQ